MYLSSKMVYLFPLSMYDGEQNVATDHADRCLLPHYLWERIIQDETLQNHDLYLMEFSNDTHHVTLSVGGGHHDDESLVFVPQWVFGIFSEGAPVRYKPLRTIPPHATKITIKPLDNMLSHVDMNEEVSRYLSDWHVLEEGLMLQIHLQSIDYHALMYIESVEPSPLVLLRGEVPLEVVPMEAEEPPVPARPSTQPPIQPPPSIQPPPPTQIPECFFGPMVPTTAKPVLPPAPTQKNKFPGVGRRLCDP